MTVIKKLIISEWFKFFFGSVFILFVILTVGNLLSGLLRSNVTPAEVIINYLIELPSSFSKILPVGCLIASLFSINKLKSKNELTAIFASGFSRKKYLTTIFQISIVIAILQFFNSSYLQPFIKKHRDVLISDGHKKFRNLKSKGLRSTTVKGTGYIWYKSKNYYFSFSAFDKKRNILNDISLYYFDKDYKLKQKIYAQKATYIKKKFWLFSEGLSYDFINQKKFPEVNAFKTLKIKLSEDPTDFKKIEADITTLDIVALSQYINRLKKSGINTREYEVDLFSKISDALICILFALIAAIPLFNPNRRSSSLGLNLFFVFVFTIVYWLFHSYFIELGKNATIHPIVSCFSIPFIFLILLIIIFYKNRRIN